jgi:hypothetical protein
MLELCIRNIGDAVKIKEELEAKVASEKEVEVAVVR